MAQDSTRRYAAAGNEFEIASTYYDAAAVESVAADLRSLDHGPEMAELSVYVATADELREICGATVIACYAPSLKRMMISGEDRSAGGVSRDFAIAHEYGHHIANSQLADSIPAIESGTIRWATYERVCQLTRKNRLFPGDQGNHYWENPEEAFAQSYAQLNQPDAGVSWQYTPLLQPTPTSLAKIQADVAKPWHGPATSTLSGTLVEPSSATAHRVASAGSTGIDSAVVVGTPPWVAQRLIRTPLDGKVSVSLQAPAGADFAVALRSPDTGRVVSRAITGEGGTAEVSYSNCGHAAVQLEVRSRYGAGPFSATVIKP